MKEFHILTKEEEKLLSVEETKNYYLNLKNYLKSLPFNYFKLFLQQKVAYPILYKLICLQRIKDKGELILINEPQIPKNRSILFAINHNNIHDIPYISEALKVHYIGYGGNEIENSIKGLMLKLSGCVFVDRNNSKNKEITKNEFINYLAHGYNGLICPEATWFKILPNRDNYSILPIWPGAVEIALKSGAMIMACGLIYEGKKCYINFGKAYDVDYNKSIEENKKILSDEMLSQLWEIRLTLPNLKRESNPPEKLRAKLIKEIEYRRQEFPEFNSSLEEKYIFEEESKIASFEEVFEPFQNLTKGLAMKK